MIKANELRIGNLVNTPDGIREVDSISANGINHNYWPDGGIEWDYKLNDLAGLPLTEEWLLKFGFEHKFDNIFTYPFKISDNLVVEMKFEGWPENISLFTNGFFSSNSIKYVHQLQNLYHALAGEELTIKESDETKTSPIVIKPTDTSTRFPIDDIIDQAKLKLPEITITSPQNITIPVGQTWVEFTRCYVTASTIEFANWMKPMYKYKEVWIPNNYFGGAIPATSQEDLWKEERLNEYLLKEKI